MRRPLTALPSRFRARRGVLILVLAAIVVLTVGVPVTGGLSRSAPTAAPTPLRIWYGTDDPTERAWTRELARRFEREHPAVRVTLVTYALDDLHTKAYLALSAGNPPDLIYTTPRGPGLPAYLRAGQLRDLTAAAREHGWAGTLRSGLLDEYNRLLSADHAHAGRVYAVPYTLAAVAVLYNKALFQRHGLRVPRTLAELEATAERAKRAGLVPFGLGNADGWLGDDWWLTLVNARTGPAALTPVLRVSDRFTFAAPPFRWAAATLQDWAQRGLFTPHFGGLDAQDSVVAFFAGKTAMQLVSSTQNAHILSLARATGLSVGIFPFPSVTPGRPPVMPQSGYAGWAVPRAAQHPEAALAFIDHVLSTRTAELLLSRGMVPAHRIEPKAALLAAPFQREYLDALASALPGVYLDGAPVPNLNATMEANLQLLLQGVETPDFLVHSLQAVYSSRGARATQTRTDGEF